MHEECGVFGIWSPVRKSVPREIYLGLYALQHRGQESCGIAVSCDGVFHHLKGDGLVGDVFSRSSLDRLGEGNIAVGHVRYSTTGGKNHNNIQPIVISHMKGNLALCHNGNLVNARSLRTQHELNGGIFHGTADTETIIYTIVSERLKVSSTEEAVFRTMQQLQGAYSCALMTATKLIAFRDPNGFRPLCCGRTADGSWVVSSESCALDAVGAKMVRDIDPGEIVVFGKDGVVSDRRLCGKPRSLCVFEYIYFARPDSTVDGVQVHEARARAGELLAQRHPASADVVIGAPDSGLDAAIGYSRRSGIPYGIGLIKNKYIGRTFISPGQNERIDGVRIKLSAVDASVRGKRVVLVDDSIVRGNTMGRVVQLLRDAGALEVHVRTSAPPFLHPCYYGTDIDSRAHLIACHHSVAEIANIIGADSLGYLHVADLPAMTGCAGLCTACFDGKYPTAVPTETRRDRFERRLSEKEAQS